METLKKKQVMAPITKSRNFLISKDLSPERRKIIDALVDSVRKKIGFNKPPLELAKLEIAIPEIQICELPHSPIGSEICFLDNAKRIAQINVRSKETRQSKILNICHALGHYFLHPREEFACRMDFYGDISMKEAEATYFAETLIMPNRLVKKMYQNMADDYDPIYKMARRFAVKRQIMEDRLQSLDLL